MAVWDELYINNNVAASWDPFSFRNDMETLFTLLVLCEGKSTVTGEFPSQRPGNAKHYWRHSSATVVSSPYVEPDRCGT